MIDFRELTILQCGKSLEIDATIKYKSEFPNAYISKLTIDTASTFIDNGPSTTPVYVKTYPATTNAIVESITKEQLNNIDLKSTLFFVYIEVQGLPEGYDTCKYGPSITIKAVANLQKIYGLIINSVKANPNNCSDNSALINNMMLLKAFEYANSMCNFRQIIKIWNRILNKKGNIASASKGCGCNG
jgi:superfamily I DNA and/or RNA helicase